MKFEDFVEAHAGDSPCQKLLLLMENECYRRDDAITAERDRLNGNEKGEAYMRSEEKEMALRCEWLYREIVVALTRSCLSLNCGIAPSTKGTSRNTAGQPTRGCG